MSAKLYGFTPIATPHVLKVIGVGDAGSNAVEQMIRDNVGGVEFICCNTDAQALQRSSAPIKLQLGPGLSAEGIPEYGRVYALAARERIAEALQGAEMVFIVAGLGGGTGTGASPIVAEITRSLGIFTLAVITLPFRNEGQRIPLADTYVAKIARQVDCPIVIRNGKVPKLIGTRTDVFDALRTPNDAMCNAVKAIAEMINAPGLMNADLADLKTVMGNPRQGRLRGFAQALMGSGMASGADRIRVAIEMAVSSPLLEGKPLSDASNVLLNVTAGTAFSFKELKEAMGILRQYIHPQAILICGCIFDDRLVDGLRVTVIACGATFTK